MARGNAISTALVLLSATITTTTASSIWTVNIDTGPAPSPEDGPSFSAHASRDPSLLKYQIVGIVGAYVASVFIIGSLLLTVGRTLRKRAQDMAARPTEMVKPLARHFGSSPISPASSSRGWHSPRRIRPKKSVASSMRSANTAISPEVRSIASFDNNVIEADRQKRQDEMERLYAAVMKQDERRSPQLAGLPSPPLETPRGAPPEYSRRVPPRLITDAPGLRHLQTPDQFGAYPQSPMTPKSPVRAIYPPDSQMPMMPSSPTNPIRAEYPSAPLTPTYFQQPSSQMYPSTYEGASPSFGSTRSGSSTSRGKASKLRRLKISSPIQTLDDNSDGARTPLSPRFYVDPGTPPEPPTARTDDSQFPPTTPGTATSWRRGDDYEQRYSEREHMDQIRALPRPHPNRIGSYGSEQQQPAFPEPPAISTTQLRRPQQPVASVNNTLPFRQMQVEQQQQQQQQQQKQRHTQFRPNPSLYPPVSAGPVKTTFLETGRRGAFLGTPRTGMATPYSPYMPYTPLTPVTPRLISRAERKQRMKEDRATRGVLTEEQQVKDEGEVWGSESL